MYENLSMRNGRIKETFLLGSGLQLFVTFDNEVYHGSSLHPNTFLGTFSGYVYAGRGIQGEYGKLGFLYGVELSKIEDIIRKDKCYGDLMVINPCESTEEFKKGKMGTLSSPLA